MSNTSSHQLTITSGTFRGRKLIAPVVSTTHPMGSREKMALFNSLTSLIGPLESVENVLDCYCGSGALGLEALSRGAKRAVFVDNNVSALQATKDNIATLGLSDRSEVIKSSIEDIASTSVSWQKYDLILADPPYDHFPASLAQLANLLKDQGILALSHPTSVSPAKICPNLTLLSTKSYASANLSFFQKM
ncbi:RsmD family RNA methyltransferase [Candidatus Saccharibacteria bacterium]|nr:RsmD family RNA methyltransferase [Candidatus Saccharibacteria bacterium]